MPSPLQQPSTRRKLLYFALIFALFVVNTFLWRGLENSRLPWPTVTAQANELELRELNQGEAELLGSTLRLGLTGSRGLAVTLLWSAAIEKQKKNEWNELELIVRSLTKLQPHFLTPWLFQSWNLAYNVSVESDRVKDKYFYITRGIELLAQGERLNRDNPDMRFWTGFYYMNKFGMSDEQNTLKSLLQLSCIPPSERDPSNLRPDGRNIDMAAFEKFANKNPQLVRRLREYLRCNSPVEVVEFLADNRKLPTRYVDPVAEGGLFQSGKPGELKPIDQQFPILPSQEPIRFADAREPTAQTPVLGDDFDNNQFARAWYSYSQDPLPEAEKMTEIKDRTERVAGIKGRRLPRQPAEVIFRQYPARAQSYTAERLLKEGWFDASGWNVDANRSGRNRWFKDRDVAVGTGVNWCVDAWSLAHKMWRAHGERTGVYLDYSEIQRLNGLAQDYRKEFNIGASEMGPDVRLDKLDERLRQSMLAHRQIFFYEQSRGMTNFPHHYFRALSEQDPQTVEGRKLMFAAERFRQAAEPERAIETYQQAFDVWKKVFERYPAFREDTFIQDETYETELRYLELIREHRGSQLRPALIAQGVLTDGLSGLQGASSPAQFVFGVLHGLIDDSKSLPMPVLGPLDGQAPYGEPWILPTTIREVRSKLGLPIDLPQSLPLTVTPVDNPMPP